MKTCPYCAEAIPDDAQVCPQCQTSLAAAAPAAPAPGVPGDAFPAGAEQTSGKAIASLVCGIIGLIMLPIFSSIPAIVLGHLSLAEIQRSAGRLKGHGMALAGLVMGYIGVVFLPVILIIAAIAIPNLLRAKIAANEASAVGSLRTITTAEIAYSSACPKIGFTSSLAEMGPRGSACAEGADLIDRTLAGGVKSGYRFTPRASSFTGRTPEIAFGWNADPISESTGTRHFFVDQSGMIRCRPDGPADGESPPVQ